MFLPQKNTKIIECKNCNFVTCNIKDYNRHILTRKHENTMKYNVFYPKNPCTYSCECGKVYPYRSSLYNHKKTCNFHKQINSEKDEATYKDLFLSLVKENKELCNNIITNQNEIKNQIINNKFESQIIGNNNSITKNKLNINIFLNEECKDALTINQFMDKIKVSLDNLLVTRDKGITEGVSNIFIENMNKLSLRERPLHCTDTKRETVYIKYDNQKNDGLWEQDCENKKLKEALKQVSLAQQKNMIKWTEENPEWETDHKLQDEYMKLVKNCTDNIDENKRTEKIVKKVCNKIYISDLNNDN